MSKPTYAIQYIRPDTPLRQAILQWLKQYYPHHRLVYAPVLDTDRVLVSLVPFKGHHLPIMIPMDELRRFLSPTAIHDPLASAGDE